MDERTHARYMSDIAYFLSKMEAEPNSGYFIPIALAYNKLEKYDETIAMCKSAIERFPANCAAKTFLAEAYVYKGQFDLARDLLFDVTAEDDNNYKALKLLGIICKENGDTTDALKYLTGAYIRSPEDEEVRKMIEELGGSLNPAQIYDERMKRQSQAALDSEEDEELRTYQEIDQRIRNAEIIMADLVADTTISARDYSEEEDFYSDDPNDFMPLITQHEEEEEEFSDDPNDFLPTITENAQEEEDQTDQNEEEEISVFDLHIAVSIDQTDDQLNAVNIRFTSGDDIRYLFEGEYTEESFEEMKTDQELEIDFNDFPNVLQEVLDKVPDEYKATIKLHDEGHKVTLALQQELEFCTTDIFTFTLDLASAERIEKVSQERYNELLKQYQQISTQYKDMVKRIKRQDPKILDTLKPIADDE